MTPNPECAGFDTTLVDALHIMHDGKFLHLPVTDHDGFVVTCLDVLQLTHGAVATARGAGSGGQDMATTMLQRFWDSALALEPAKEGDDSHILTCARSIAVIPLNANLMSFRKESVAIRPLGLAIHSLSN